MPRNRFGFGEPSVVRRLVRILSQCTCAGLLVFLLAACRVPGSVKSTVKLGLSAPFEGLHRDLGYEALHAVRLAVRERNAQGGVGQRYLVELVALNDFNEIGKAIDQARKMAVDPGVLGVLGGFSQETQQVASEYEQLGLTFLAPEVDISSSDSLIASNSEFAAQYTVVSGGAPPGGAAMWAYSAANDLLDAMDDAATSSGAQPARSDVERAMRSADQ